MSKHTIEEESKSHFDGKNHVFVKYGMLFHNPIAEFDVQTDIYTIIHELRTYTGSTIMSNPVFSSESEKSDKSENNDEKEKEKQKEKEITTATFTVEDRAGYICKIIIYSNSSIIHDEILKCATLNHQNVYEKSLNLASLLNLYNVDAKEVQKIGSNSIPSFKDVLLTVMFEIRLLFRQRINEYYYYRNNKHVETICDSLLKEYEPIIVKKIHSTMMKNDYISETQQKINCEMMMEFVKRNFNKNISDLQMKRIKKLRLVEIEPILKQLSDNDLYD